MARRRRLLILVPTPREVRLVFGSTRPPARVELTGLGLAAAAAAASRSFARLEPDAALLVGIAGTLDARHLPVGGLLVARRVACDGIGAGEGRGFTSFAGPPIALAAIELAGTVGGELLSVAAAAGSPAMARRRRSRHPRALAEEMEGYGVALAARLAGVPLTILRGVSNVAGDRDQRRWRAHDALAACRAALHEWIEVASR